MIKLGIVDSTGYTGVVLQALFEKHYADEPSVDVMPTGPHPQTLGVRGGNVCRMAMNRPQVGEPVVVLSVIDNLVEVASEPAVQNVSILFGVDEWLGASHAAQQP